MSAALLSSHLPVLAFFPCLERRPCQTSSGLDSTRLEEEEDEEGE